MPATGRIIQVIGSTFDAEFPAGQLPNIYNAVKVHSHDGSSKIELVGEVQQHLGGGRIRAVALGSTDGLRRGMDCLDPEHRAALRKAGLLTRDPRAKERKKPGLKRARKAPQFTKR